MRRCSAKRNDLDLGIGLDCGGRAGEEEGCVRGREGTYVLRAIRNSDDLRKEVLCEFRG